MLRRLKRLDPDSWQFWMVIAYFGLVLVITAVVFAFAKIGHEEAARAATSKSANVSQVSGCFTAVKNAPVVRGFIDGEQALISNSLIANRAALKTAAADDPLTMIRKHSITRLEKASKNLDELRSLVEKTTPTKAKCVKLAGELKVDYRPYLKKK